jgi:hypothetical protein
LDARPYKGGEGSHSHAGKQCRCVGWRDDHAMEAGPEAERCNTALLRLQ